MEVRVTASDIKQSAELLQMLERWQRCTDITREYNGGSVSLVVSGAKDAVKVECSVDTYYLRNTNQKNAVDQCQTQIGLLVGSRVAQLAKEVAELIRSHMPLPLER